MEMERNIEILTTIFLSAGTICFGSEVFLFKDFKEEILATV